MLEPVHIEKSIFSPRAVQFAINRVALRNFNLFVISSLLIGYVATEALASAGVEFMGFDLFRQKLFGMSDGSISTFYSTINLVFAGLLSLFVTSVNVGKKRFFFAWLAVILLFMSIDECVMIHESLGGLGRKLWGVQAEGVFFFGWYLVVVPLFGLSLLPLLCLAKAIDGTERFEMLLILAVFLLGAVGMEMLESLFAFNESPWKQWTVVLEEGLEMLAVVALVDMLLRKLISTSPRFSLKLNG
jgi:hypothetical protein